MSGDTTNWTELREFKAVDLAQSYVLSWHIDAGALLVDTDLYLLPEHALYEKPRPSEKACYRPAYIEFPYCTRVDAGGKGGDKAITDAVRQLGSGRIAGFMRTGEGRYEMRGEFGTVAIDAGRPMLRLKHTRA